MNEEVCLEYTPAELKRHKKQENDHSRLLFMWGVLMLD